MGKERKAKVTGHVLREMRDNRNIVLANHFNSFQQVLDHEDMRENCISFTCLLYNPNDKLVYCGITSLSNDILYTFNPKTKKFRSLNYAQADGAEKYDVKVHRSLCLDDDGMIYGATACLHGVPDYREAPGGKIFRYDPKKDKIEILTIPFAHEYVQTITLDKARKIIYGCTYPSVHLFRYDIRTNRTTDLGLTVSAPHRPAIDREGNLWSLYNSNHPGDDRGTKLLRYNPDQDKLNYGPWPDSCQMVRKGNDDMTLGPDGMIYIGCGSGELLRLDPQRAEMEYLGKPFHSRRLTTRFGTDGLLYLASGFGQLEKGGANSSDSAVFSYNTKTGQFHSHGYLFDAKRKLSCVLVHDIAITDDGLAYVAETDNFARSGYLWECEIAGQGQ